MSDGITARALVPSGMAHAMAAKEMIQALIRARFFKDIEVLIGVLSSMPAGALE
jgi:hypothetical protein